MDSAGIISSVGLGLDIIGVVLLFKFGLPPRVSETGGTSIKWPGGKSNEEAKEEYQHYKQMGYVGLGLLVVGFSLQLISNFFV